MRFLAILLLAAVFALASARMFAKPDIDAQILVFAFSFGVGAFVLGRILRRF
jgi:hypothetical protein